ncbi:uncharacterized protein LOC135944866 [Cloeon dipterum]|uniref:uncharacterized protein LOC135944866 n=1 Tax=Cloeon dipterum TaxID=197152 RepID=UPI00321FA062
MSARQLMNENMSTDAGDDALQCDLGEQLDVLQNHALQKHEEFLDNRTKLLTKGEDLEKICSEIKNAKAKNSQRKMQLEKVTFQNTDLKKLVVGEEFSISTLNDKQKSIETKINASKAEYLIKLREYEMSMAKKAAQFSIAPHEYGFKKVSAEVDSLLVKTYNCATKKVAEAENAKNRELFRLAEVKIKAAPVLQVLNLLNKKKLTWEQRRLCKAVSDVEKEVEMLQAQKKLNLKKLSELDWVYSFDRM